MNKRGGPPHLGSSPDSAIKDLSTCRDDAQLNRSIHLAERLADRTNLPGASFILKLFVSENSTLHRYAAGEPFPRSLQAEVRAGVNVPIQFSATVGPSSAARNAAPLMPAPQLQKCASSTSLGIFPPKISHPTQYPTNREVASMDSDIISTASPASLP